jgi:hypothetical protein
MALSPSFARSSPNRGDFRFCPSPTRSRIEISTHSSCPRLCIPARPPSAVSHQRQVRPPVTPIPVFLSARSLAQSFRYTPAAVQARKSVPYRLRHSRRVPRGPQRRFVLHSPLRSYIVLIDIERPSQSVHGVNHGRMLARAFAAFQRFGPERKPFSCATSEGTLTE